MFLKELEKIILECQDIKTKTFPLLAEARQLRAHPDGVDAQRQIYDETIFAKWILDAASTDQDYAGRLLAGPELDRSPAGRALLIMLVAAFDEIVHTKNGIDGLPVSEEAKKAGKERLTQILSAPQYQALIAWVDGLSAKTQELVRKDIEELRKTAADLPALLSAPADAPNFPCEIVTVASVNPNVMTAPGQLLTQVADSLFKIDAQLEAENLLKNATEWFNQAKDAAKETQAIYDQASAILKITADASSGEAKAGNAVTAANRGVNKAETELLEVQTASDNAKKAKNRKEAEDFRDKAKKAADAVKGYFDKVIAELDNAKKGLEEAEAAFATLSAELKLFDPEILRATVAAEVAKKAAEEALMHYTNAQVFAKQTRDAKAGETIAKNASKDADTAADEAKQHKEDAENAKAKAMKVKTLAEAQKQLKIAIKAADDAKKAEGEATKELGNAKQGLDEAGTAVKLLTEQVKLLDTEVQKAIDSHASAAKLAIEADAHYQAALLAANGVSTAAAALKTVEEAHQRAKDAADLALKEKENASKAKDAVNAKPELAIATAQLKLAEKAAQKADGHSTTAKNECSIAAGGRKTVDGLARLAKARADASTVKSSSSTAQPSMLIQALKKASAANEGNDAGTGQKVQNKK